MTTNILNRSYLEDKVLEVYRVEEKSGVVKATTICKKVLGPSQAGNIAPVAAVLEKELAPTERVSESFRESRALRTGIPRKRSFVRAVKRSVVQSLILQKDRKPINILQTTSIDRLLHDAALEAVVAISDIPSDCELNVNALINRWHKGSKLTPEQERMYALMLKDLAISCGATIHQLGTRHLHRKSLHAQPLYMTSPKQADHLERLVEARALEGKTHILPIPGSVRYVKITDDGLSVASNEDVRKYMNTEEKK